MALTDKQKRFVEEYMIDLNATQAAIRAGYSPKSANEIAAENLAKPSIANEIAKLQAEQSKKTGVTAERVIRELAVMAFADDKTMQKYRMKGQDRSKCLELLSKHLGLLTEKVDMTVAKSEKLEEIFTQIGGEGLDE